MVSAKPQRDNRYANLIDSQRYTIVKRLTGGGMSDVYVARDLKFSGRQVAIKMLKHSLVDNPELQKRLKQEIAVCAAIENEHVVQVSDYGVTAAGHPYCVMEFLEGQTLGTLLSRDHRLAPERAIQIATQVCVGLQAAHRGVVLKPNRSRKRVRIVHRDLKPDNIFLVPHPVWGEMVKILDFGIAKLYWEQLTDSKATSYGFKGSLRYASPEQWTGSDRIDSRADLYSLGVVLYEMLSGTNPFGIEKSRHTSLQAWLDAHTRGTPIPLDRQPGCDRLHPELVGAVMRCLAKEPDERFADADELRAALVPFLPQAATHPPARAISAEVESSDVAAEGAEAADDLNLPVPPHLLEQTTDASFGSMAANESSITGGSSIADAPGGAGINSMASEFGETASFDISTSDLFSSTASPSRHGTSEPTITLPPDPALTSAPKSRGSAWRWVGGSAVVAAAAVAAWLWGNPLPLRQANRLARSGNYEAAIDAAKAIPTWQRSHAAARAALPAWQYDHALAIAQAGDFQTAHDWVERTQTEEARALARDLTRLLAAQRAMSHEQYGQVTVSASAIAAGSPLYAMAQSQLCEAIATQLAPQVRAQISMSFSGMTSGPSFAGYQLQGCNSNRLRLQTDVVALKNRQPTNLKLIALAMAGLMWETLPADLQTDWQDRTMQVEFRVGEEAIAVATLPTLALVPQVAVNLDEVLSAMDIQTPS